MIPMTDGFIEFTNIQSLWLYLSLFLVSIAGYVVSVQATRLNDVQRRILRLLILLLISFVLGIRYFLGTDYQNYLKLMTTMNVNATEPLNYIFYTLGTNNKQIAFGAYVFFTVFFVMKALDKFFENPWHKIFSFTAYTFIFLPHCLNTVREGLALAVLLYATAFLMKKEYKFGILWFIMSCLIHNVVIIFAPIVFVLCWKKRLTYKTMIFYVFVLFAAWLMSVVELPFEYPERIRFYIENLHSDWSIGILVISIPYILYTVLLLMKKKNTEDFSFARNVSVIVLTSFIVRHLAYMNIYFLRFSNPFNILKVILFAFVPYLAFTYFPIAKTKRNAWIIFGVFLVINIVYFILEFYIGGTGDIFPYRYKLMV